MTLVWPRWRLDRLDAALVHAVLLADPSLSRSTVTLATELERVLLAARRRDAYDRRRAVDPWQEPSS